MAISEILSPLRYPGGKSKLYNYTRKLIKTNNLRDCVYIEPYAGGCGLAIKLLSSGVVENLMLNDIDISIYSFWKAVLNDNERLIRKILDAEISIEEWHIQKRIQDNKSKASSFDLAFSTLFLNRTNFSGIIKARPIGGLKQKGNYLIDSRFNKQEIIKRLRHVYELRDNIKIYNKDAIEFLDDINNLCSKNVFIFLDPPYFKKGPRLYTNFYIEQDHIDLAKQINNLKQNWVVTYDNVEEIKNIYRPYNLKFKEYSLRYSANNKYDGTEVMFYSKDLKPISFSR